MTPRDLIPDEDLHAFIDGELAPARANALAAAIEADTDLASRVAAFAADKAALATAYRGFAEAPVPAAWVARINLAAAPARVAPRKSTRPAWAMALAACLVVAIGTAAFYKVGHRPEDGILLQADAARLDRVAPVARLSGAALAPGAARDAVLRQAVGLNVQAPDLARLGWRLGEIDTYPRAVALRYRDGSGTPLTLFVRRSDGVPRFELLKSGTLRTCIWQDEVVGAVMMGEMSAGQMMRVASAAYLALDL